MKIGIIDADLLGRKKHRFPNYILRERNHDVDKTDYDIEHCVTKKTIRDFYLKKNITVPMSSVCNLAYIPASENRGKQDWTYYQKQDADSHTCQLNSTQLDNLAYTERDELRFVESTETLTEENYYLFLKNRKELLLKRIMECFSK